MPKKKWMLHHLSEAGFKGQHLYKLYCCYIRSIIEYGSPVYHSLLNGAQELRLERLQRHALRVCFGYHRPIKEVMGELGISTLKDRRGRRCDNFIRKAAKNPRFADAWFPEASHPLQPEKQKTRAGNSSKFGEVLQITASLPQTEGQRVGERPGQLGMERVMEESADRSGAPGWSGVQGYSASRCSVSFRIIYEYFMESGIICYCYERRAQRKTPYAAGKKKMNMNNIAVRRREKARNI